MYILGLGTSYLAWNWAADFRTGFVFTVSLTVFEISLSDWVNFRGSGQCKNWRQFWVKAKMLPWEPFKIQTKQKLFWNQHLNHKLVIWFLNFFNILQILAKIQTLDEKSSTERSRNTNYEFIHTRKEGLWYKLQTDLEFKYTIVFVFSSSIVLF